MAQNATLRATEDKDVALHEIIILINLRSLTQAWTAGWRNGRARVILHGNRYCQWNLQESKDIINVVSTERRATSCFYEGQLDLI